MKAADEVDLLNMVYEAKSELSSLFPLLGRLSFLFFFFHAVLLLLLLLLLL